MYIYTFIVIVYIIVLFGMSGLVHSAIQIAQFWLAGHRNVRSEPWGTGDVLAETDWLRGENW